MADFPLDFPVVFTVSIITSSVTQGQLVETRRDENRDWRKVFK